MRTLIFTGDGGSGVALAAAATASAAAQAGQNTLLVGIGPSQSLNTLLGTPVSGEPQPIAPNLAAWAPNVLEDLRIFWEQARAYIPKDFNIPPISGDELPLMPGLDLFLGLERLRRQAANGYDLVVVDIGPPHMLLRTLAVPDSFRWGLRLMFGLDRGPGRSTASMNRALVPSALLPFEWVSQVQEARVRLEQLRDMALDVSHTSIRYVLRPDTAALDEARVVVPALHLHGVAVDALVAGPLLPADISDVRLAAIIAHQQEVVATAERIWSPRPLLRLPLSMPSGSIGDLTAIGAELYAGRRPHEVYSVAPPIEWNNGQAPYIAISLPGAPREFLGLTLSGDELIVHVGPYRRHLLLPEALRGTSNIKASREGERLFVRQRQ